MGNKYGKSALSASYTMPNFEKYLDAVQAAGRNIDDVCAEAVEAAGPIILDAMKEGAARHRKDAGRYGTDNVYNAIEILPTKRFGNLILGSVGIDMKKHPEAIHGVYQEYGDGHSPQFPDPFVRPAVDDNQRQIRAAMVKVLKKRGVPIE